MATHSGKSRRWRDVLRPAACTVLLIASAAGCSHHAAVDPLAVDMATVREIQHGMPEGESLEVVEIELGDYFAINRRSREGDAMAVSFQMYAVIASDRTGELADLLERRRQRVSESVRTVIESSDVSHLAAPGLDVLKSDLTRAINNTLKTRIVKSVAFTDFSLEAG